MSNRQPSSSTCFVCGRDNPVGLRMGWVNDPEAGEIRGEVVIPEHFNGYPGVAHGGIIGAILDETAGRTTLMESADADNLMVTVHLEVTYRRPTPTGVPLTAVGRLVERGGRRSRAEAELRRPDGTVTATAHVVLAPPPTAVMESFEAEREHWR